MPKNTKKKQKAKATKIHNKLLDRAAASGSKMILSKANQKLYLQWFKPRNMKENMLLCTYSNLPLYSNEELVARMTSQLRIENLNAHTVTLKPINATGATKISLILMAKVGVDYKGCVHDFKLCFDDDGELNEDVRQFTTTREVARWIEVVSTLIEKGVCVKVTLAEQLTGAYIITLHRPCFSCVCEQILLK